eukprot:3173503-Pleurochrysis_carterae.AAC.1
MERGHVGRHALCAHGHAHDQRVCGRAGVHARARAQVGWESGSVWALERAQRGGAQCIRAWDVVQDDGGGDDGGEREQSAALGDSCGSNDG